MDIADGNGGSCRQVVTELSRIKELVTQLKAHLGGCPDLCKHLAAQIFSLADRSMSMIMSPTFDDRKRSAVEARFAGHLPFKNTKKRKTMEQRKHQVRVSSSADDGHSWRKYGQKEILGAKHPRGYYRCTHRHSQGCPATKQVQRTDEDTTLFDVIYHGEHTCVPKAAAAAAGEAAAATRPPEHNHRDAQSLSASLTVKTEGLAVTTKPQGWSPTTPFCFSSTPARGCLAPEHRPFSAPEKTENWGVSPVTSDSNQFVSFAPSGPTAGDAEYRAQSEFQEVVSALVAAVSAPEPAVDTNFADELFNLDPSVENPDQSILSYFADPYVADEQ